MIGYLIFAVLFLGGVYASYTDIKIREVSNFLSFGMLFAVLGLRLIDGFYLGNLENMIISLMVGGIFFAMGSAFFYAQQWGGADVKLIAAYGIGFGTLPKEFMPFVMPAWPFAFTILMNFFIIAVVYAMAYSVAMAFKNRKVVSDFRGSLKKYEVFAGFVLIMFLFVLGFYYKIMFVILLMPLLWFLSKFLKSVEKNCMLLRKNVKELVEFDIPEKDVKIGKKILASSKEPNGMTLEQIRKIQKFAKLGKLPKFMKVKWGVPLVPVFPISLIVSLFFGDLMYLILRTFV